MKTLAADTGSTPARHTPCFHWLQPSGTHGFVCDGPEMVAALYAGEAQQHGPARPISFHNLRLAPRGPRIIAREEGCGPLCLTWRKHLIFYMSIDELRFDDTDPRCFRLYVRTHDNGLRADQPGAERYAPRSLTEETWLRLTWNAELGSYVFDVRMRLRANPGRSHDVLAHDKRGLEFADLLPAGANDRFPPHGRKRYTHVVYRAADGRLYSRPQNKHMGPDKVGVRYAPDGMLAFVGEPDADPVIEFTNGTGRHVHSEICWAMYDVHFKLRRSRQTELLRSGAPLEVTYRFYAVRGRQAADWLARSTPDPVLQHTLVRCPVFAGCGLNHFTPATDFRAPSDHWFWQASDSCCSWTASAGPSGQGCLQIVRPTAERPPEFPGEPWTEMFACSTDGSTRSQWEFPRLTGSAAYRVRATVRTTAVHGRVFMAVEYRVPVTKDPAAASMPREHAGRSHADAESGRHDVSVSDTAASGHEARGAAGARLTNCAGNAAAGYSVQVPTRSSSRAVTAPADPFAGDNVQCSEKLSGTHYWVTLELLTQPPANASRGPAALFLVLDGTGSCWFDAVEITPAPAP